VFVAQGADCRGAILLQPVVRPEVPALIRRLQARGLDVHILSGDDVGPTAALAEALGIRTWQARALPEDKAEVLRALRAQGRKVFLVGDGVNDALAMREATVSAAMGGGSSLAMQSAQILLHEGNLEQLDALFDLGRRHQVTRQRLLDASVVPTLLSFGGVLFAGVGVIGATGIYIGAMGVGLVLALRDGTWTPPSQEG
jgi:Cu2+-exporting ATPase